MAYRAKKQRRDRDRKRALAIKRASELPALPIPDGDRAWLAPDAEQPHFIGEYVWHSTGSETTPQLAVVEQLYRDGSANLRLHCSSVVKAAPTDTLCRVGVAKLSYIGQRVEIEDAGV